MKLRSLLAGASLLATVGCASIMHGPNQGISVNSTPAGAAVSVDGKPMGTTPTVVRLARKSTHTVRLDLQGYQPYEMALTKGTSGWVWGNIVFGGLIGLGIDAATGSIYKLTPDVVTADMRTRTATVDGKELIEVAVVMTPDASWQKIGQLLPE